MSGAGFSFDWETCALRMDGGTPVLVHGEEAAEAWMEQALHIPRGRLGIYPATYGTSAHRMIGQRLPEGYALSELQREIAENAALCPDIESTGALRWAEAALAFPMKPVQESEAELPQLAHEDIVPPVVITQQPQDAAAAGGTARFTVAAEGSGLSYQWQYLAPGGATWANTTLTGNKTDTLSVSATSGRNGYRYRCTIRSGSFLAASDPAQLTVIAAQGLSALADDDGEEGRR